MSVTQALRQVAYDRGYSLPPVDPEESARLAAEAKQFPVTRLPYAGERTDLKFDRRSHRPLKGRLTKRLGDAELSYSDYQNGLSIRSHATAFEMRLLYTPIFAASDEQLKLVVAQAAYDYVCASHAGTSRFYCSERVPNGFLLNRQALEDLAKKATDSRKSYNQQKQQINLYRHISWCEIHKGYLALRASIAYKAWREAKDSATIAANLGMTHVAVRQILHRLCKTALRLGLETFPPHHSAHKGRVFRPYEVEKAKASIQPYKDSSPEEIAA
jgi:hypothetical protein